MIRCKPLVAWGFTLLAGAATADTIHLKSGGRLEGVLVSEGKTTLTLDVGMGRVTLPRTSIESIDRGESALSAFRSRLQAVKPGDLQGFLLLGRFAADAGLGHEARIAWSRVLEIDPTNIEAHLALGHVLVDGRYLDEEDAYRQRGYVRFEGGWVTPAEQSAILRERESRRDDAVRVAEARRAARDAEERARRAEAEAARARAAAAAAANTYGSGGVFVGSPHWGGGYGGGCYGAACTTVPPIWPAPPPVLQPTPIPVTKPVHPTSLRGSNHPPV